MLNRSDNLGYHTFPEEMMPVDLSTVEATYLQEPEPGLLLWSRPGAATDLRLVVEELLHGDSSGSDSELFLSVPRSWTRSRATTIAGALRLKRIRGRFLYLDEVLPALASLQLAGDERHPGLPSRSLRAWSAAAKLALELVSQHSVVPWVSVHSGRGAASRVRARWRVSLGPEDGRRFEALARALPPSARAWSGARHPRSRPRLLAPVPALRSFLDTIADSMLRSYASASSGSSIDWSRQLADALGSGSGALAVRELLEGDLPEVAQGWARGGLIDAAEWPLRAAFRLEIPAAGDDDELWRLAFLARATHDPSLVVKAQEIWSLSDRRCLLFGRQVTGSQTLLLSELGRAARLWPPLADGLHTRSPVELLMTSDVASEFLTEGAAILRSAGFPVLVPQEFTSGGRRRLRARLRVVSSTGSAPAGSAVGFRFGDVVEVQWEVALGDDVLSPAELRRLAAMKQALVRWRDQWVVLDTGNLQEVIDQARQGPFTMQGAEVLRAALTGRTGDAEQETEVRFDEQPLAEVLDRLCGGVPHAISRVAGLHGSLRSYQQTGVAWLEQLAELGLGGCLADDMGLGKTVQVIAHLLCRQAAGSTPVSPYLLVCPTSVLGNWERELARFAPGLPVLQHYGADRSTTVSALRRAARPGTVVLTSYGLLRRDRVLLGKLQWEAVILDEAQAIKNQQSKVARVAFSLQAKHRIALTGTPVENRLADLWSIFRFINPGLLGSFKGFQRELARPIERFRNPRALRTLRSLCAPFLLRRTKDDPAIVPDLPAKIVLPSRCPLTAEQATLYQAAIDRALADITGSEGIDRRGRVLALITALKQICNHPAHFLRGGGTLAGRSGKLERLGDELEVVLSAGAAALIFTQYREMGELLGRYLGERFLLRVPFLHGGVSRSNRDRMVADFQRVKGPPLMIVSLRAGGTGLNLTRASHVFHFDRWWNPAVENQATDRAHRIGQEQTVFVHPLCCRGTLEERIDRMLEDKAELASVAVSSGETWITELSDAELGELLRLDRSLALEEEGE